MKDISKISIIVSFIALWITSKLESDVQTIIGFAFIFSFGILHGANDLVLLKNLKAKKNRYFSFLTLYVTVVLISALLFLTIPLIVLFLFISISAYHFGGTAFSRFRRVSVEVDESPILFRLWKFYFIASLLFSQC